VKKLFGRQVAIIGAGVLAVPLIAMLSYVVSTNTPADRRPEAVVPAAPLSDTKQGADKLEITYPRDESVFPPDIVEPTFRWKGGPSEADAWLVRIEFADGGAPLEASSQAKQWTPSPEQWREITTRTVESPAKVAIRGVNRTDAAKTLCSETIRISTSKDEVGAPLFFREVNLPFLTAVADPAKYIRWRFGPISSREPPPIVLEKLAVCGNCHSFARDGSTLAMEVDAGTEKGGYAVAPISQEIVLGPETILNWNEYKRGIGQDTFGLLCQVSPDGRYVAGTVKDRALAVYRPNLMYSQLFFLIKGIMAIYDRETKAMYALPGADDPDYVQTNASWSPDGKEIVFARSRSKAYDPESLRHIKEVLVPTKEADEFLKGGKTFLFDLYRIPFNEGKGGRAEPIPGASNNGMSNYFAKFSPDGKWIVFCKAKSFMFLQPDSELYIIPAAGGEARRLHCNTGCMNSWHSWSPNGHWLAFSSKVNGPYTQLFLTHIDAEGNNTPPVVLDRFTVPERAANIPEFVNLPPTGIRKITEQFMDDHSNWRVGAAFSKIGDTKTAERLFRLAIKQNPRSVEAHASLGSILTVTKRLDEAIEQFDAALKVDPRNVESHDGLVKVLMQMNRPDDAIKRFEAELKADPKNPASHGALGKVLIQINRPKEALQHLNAAVEFDRDSADNHNSLGVALTRLGRVQDALPQFERAVHLDSGHGEARYNLGVALAGAGRMSEAIPHFEQAVELEPKHAEAHYNLGVARVGVGNVPKAIACFQEALELKPDYAEAHYNLGVALSDTGRVREAIPHFEWLVQLNPNDAEAHNSLGGILADAGRMQEAIVHFRKAVELKPDYVAARLNLNRALQAAPAQRADDLKKRPN
jgi:tetratricopeptide (TPR) repeat protein